MLKSSWVPTLLFGEESARKAPEERPLPQSFPAVDEAVRVLRPEKPLRCFLPEELTGQARLFLSRFSGRVLCTVGINPDPFVLSVLMAGGLHLFEAASIEEIRLVRQLSPSALLAFMHPVKGRAAIRESYFRHGVRQFCLDTMEELDKILEETSFARDLTLLVRVITETDDAFGTPSGEVADLLRQIVARSAKTGLCLRLKDMTPASRKMALAQIHEISRSFARPLDLLDIGGDFSGPAAEPFLGTICEALSSSALTVRYAPGSALVESGEVHVVQILLRKKRTLYIDGPAPSSATPPSPAASLLRTGTFSKSVADPISFRLLTPNGRKSEISLPADVQEGDYVALHHRGACSASAERTALSWPRVVIETP